jgi:hypothetical protein
VEQPLLVIILHFTSISSECGSDSYKATGFKVED